MSIQPIGQQTVPLFDANGNLCVTSINDLTTIEALIATLQTYVTNGTGSVTPANTSLYDAGTWKQAAPASLSQATPTQNTWYNILAATTNVNLLGIICAVATTGETLAVQILIDGQTFTGTQVAVAGTTYYATVSPTGTVTFGTTAASSLFANQQLEGRSIQIQVRKTTNAGSGTLTGTALYQTR